MPSSPRPTRLGRWLSTLARGCHRHPWAVLAIASLALAVSLVGARRLSLDTDLTKLLPRSFDSVRNLDVLAEHSFGVGYVTVVVSGDDPAELRRFADDFAPRLEALPSVRYVDYRRPVEFFRDRALLYVPRDDLERLHDAVDDRYVWELRTRSPFNLDLDPLGEPPELAASELRDLAEGPLPFPDEPYLVSPDGRLLVLMARPDTRATDLAKADDLVGEVRELVERTDTSAYGGLTLRLSGSFQKKADQKRQIERDLSLSSLFAIGLMLLYLGLHFRRASAVALVVVPLSFGLAWTFGFAGVAIGRLNLLTGFIGAILLGIGIDHGIHLLGRYDEECQQGEEGALEAAFGDSGRAAILAAVTTVFAFVGVASSEFRAFREFGIIAAAGSLATLFAYVTLMPALLALLPRGKEALPLRRRAPFGRALERWSPAFLLAMGLGIVGATSMLDETRFDYDFASLEDSELESFVLDRKVNELLGRSQTPLVAVADDPAHETRIATALRRHLVTQPGPTSVQMVVALGDLVPEEQAAKVELLEELRDTLTRIEPAWLDEEQRRMRTELLQMSHAQPFGRDDLPDSITRQFRGSASERGFVLIFPAVSLSDGQGVRRLAADLAAVRLPDGSRPTVIGEALVTADVLDMVFEETPMVLGITALLVALVLLVALAKAWMAASCVAVAATTLLVTAGLMPIFDVPFNYLNVVMLPVLFGVGVDGSVHVVTRLDAGAAIVDVVSDTGRSIAGAILTTMLGFGALLLADHPGLRSLGALALIGLMVNLLACLVLLPAGMTLWRRRLSTA